jgi:predicted AAA+ superfamily ATPase
MSINRSEQQHHFATDEYLRDRINKMTGGVNGKYQRRDFVDPLIEFCQDGIYNGKIGIVYGLRSTGKTVGMLQAAEALEAQGYKAAYAHFNYEEVGMKSVTNEILRLAESGVTHFFIDEASYLSDFINLAPDWSDWLVPERAIKIVISGTDSFMLWIAQRTSLFHRYVQFSTNWCGFSEYKKITEESYENYRRYGGIFTEDSIPVYLHTAVVDNLLHTLDHCADEANRKTIYTARLYGIDRGVIYKAVISILKCAAEDYIITHFMKNADQKNISDLGTIIGGLYTAEKRSIKERVADSLGVYRPFRPVTEPQEVIEVLLEFLVQIGCISEYNTNHNEFGKPNTYAFAQNALMNYSVEETVDAILHTENIDKPEFIASVRQAAIGAMNESIVFSNLAHAIKPTCSIFEGDKIFKYHDTKGREIDAVIINRDDKKVCLIEVKNKSNINDDTVFNDEAKWLYDPDVLLNIGIDDSYTITRIVAYSGGSRFLTFENRELFLVNIEQLLENVKDMEPLLTGMRRESKPHIPAHVSKRNCDERCR